MTNHPKIGIRPIIAGRHRGIRKSLEEMTMCMSRKMAELFSQNFKYAGKYPENAGFRACDTFGPLNR